MPTISEIEISYPILINNIKNLFASQNPPINYNEYMTNLIETAYQNLSSSILGSYYEYGLKLWIAGRLADLLISAESGGAYPKVETSRSVYNEYSVNYATSLQGSSNNGRFLNQYALELESLLRSLTVGFMVSEP